MCKNVALEAGPLAGLQKLVLTKMFAKRFHCFLARFKISAMGGMEYYQEKINCYMRCQKISLFLIMVSRHFQWKRRKTVRRKSNTASYLVNIESTYIQTIVLTKYDVVMLFLLTVFRRFHGKWRETIIKNSEIFWHRVKGDNILLAKYTQTILNGFLRDVKRFSYF